jgi:hypothetical protein
VNIQNFSVGLIPNVPSVFIVSSEKPTVYNPIEFVALNQTKYLFKIKSTTNSTLVQFNSRFDPNWKVRPIDFKSVNDCHDHLFGSFVLSHAVTVIIYT